MNKDGSINKILENRLEKVKEITKNNNDIVIILSGGLPINGVSESEKMKKWLIDNGVKNKIIIEKESTNTIENVINSKKHLKKFDIIKIITSGFHIRRANMILEKIIKNKVIIQIPSSYQHKITNKERREMERDEIKMKEYYKL